MNERKTGLYGHLDASFGEADKPTDNLSDKPTDGQNFIKEHTSLHVSTTSPLRCKNKGCRRGCLCLVFGVNGF